MKVFAVAALAIACCAARAQALPGAVSLGLTLPELQQSHPSLWRGPQPARLAGGLVVMWSEADIDVAGVAVTPTFFFADGQLQRVEYLARDGAPASYAALLAWGRSQWGAELAANAHEGAYASWSTGDMDAYLQLANTARGEQVRLVVKRRVEKDAGEL